MRDTAVGYICTAIVFVALILSGAAALVNYTNKINKTSIACVQADKQWVLNKCVNDPAIVINSR